MAYESYIKIKGSKQGQFKGEGQKDKRKDAWLGVLAFDYTALSPRDVATGKASGKRQHKPVVIVKEWGASSPQLLQALCSNEILPEVDFEFINVKPDGTEYVFQTIKLVNATICSVRRYTDKLSKHTDQIGGDTLELEEVQFTFQRIELADMDGKTSMIDDWNLGT